MKKLFIMPITLLIIVGCAKKTELITPEISTKVIEVDSNTAIPKNTQLKILIFKLVYLQINLIIFIFVS